MNSFYSDQELKALGVKQCGKNVLISRKASIYSPENLCIGDNVRIDDFCILSGTINIGSHIHISAYTALYGRLGIVLEDYSGLSPRCSVFSAMDDFSGNYLIGPVHLQEKTNVSGGLVTIKRLAQIGTNSTIFPEVVVGEGSVIGAHSLVITSVGAWGIYAGVPVKLLRARSRDVLGLI